MLHLGNDGDEEEDGEHQVSAAQAVRQRRALAEADSRRGRRELAALEAHLQTVVESNPALHGSVMAKLRHIATQVYGVDAEQELPYVGRDEGSPASFMQLHRVLGTRQGFNPIAVIAQPLLEELYERMPANFTPVGARDTEEANAKLLLKKMLKKNKASGRSGRTESFLGGRHKHDGKVVDTAQLTPQAHGLHSVDAVRRRL